MMVVPSTPGTGVLIKDGKIIAHGLGHHFGGTMIITDGNFLVSMGKYLTAAGLERKYFQNNDTNLTADGQVHLYRWSDTDGWIELITLGRTASGDIGYIVAMSNDATETPIVGSQSDDYGAGVLGTHTGDLGKGVRGIAAGGNGIAIQGEATSGYGGYFSGGKSPLVLFPSASASAPSHAAMQGSLWLTSACVLYVNTDGGTTWQKVGAQ